MNKDILVINAGSSSLKFRLYSYEMEEKASGLCERIGVDGFFKIEYLFNKETTKYETSADFKNHENAIDFLLEKFKEFNIVSDLNDIAGIGHRIVQGGEISSSSLVDEKVLKTIEDCIKLAPLHNKPELDVLQILIKKIPNGKNVAVFDTSFHTTIPKVNNHYAIPSEWVEKHQIKKYGFHGTSYRYITEKMHEILGVTKPLNLIVCHLGNGASICCIKQDKSFDTTMGLTPLAGLIMGTRSGDIDPSIIPYVCREENLSVDEVVDKLNKASGFKGLCGSSDFRDINSNVQDGNEYEFAREIFIQKIANFVAIYKNMLKDDVDAIVFTGGIGENAAVVRKMVAEKVVGIDINKELNESKIADHAKISEPLSKFKTYVVRTNEELMIAQDTKKFLN